MTPHNWRVACKCCELTSSGTACTSGHRTEKPSPLSRKGPWATAALAYHEPSSSAAKFFCRVSFSAAQVAILFFTFEKQMPCSTILASTQLTLQREKKIFRENHRQSGKQTQWKSSSQWFFFSYWTWTCSFLTGWHTWKDLNWFGHAFYSQKPNTSTGQYQYLSIHPCM